MTDIGLTLPENLLSPARGVKGPVTKGRQRRTLIIYLAMIAIGIAPYLLGASPAMQAAGFGLWIPGGGFVALGGWSILLFALTFILFCLSLIAWFWAGMVILPVGIWLGSAIIAGLMADQPTFQYTPVILGLVIIGIAGSFARRNRRLEREGVEKAKVREAFLPSSLAQVKENVARGPAEHRELSTDQLAGVRYLLDRALQPIESFDGFTIVDQFQPAAIRYQLNHIGFALAIVQRSYAPNFRGYLAQAQQNLIEKYLQKRVWDYWVLESCWGHLNFTNWDPADEDNIMLTGWFGAQVGQYMVSSGDRRYLEPSSLTFRLNKKTAYRHDFGTIAGSLNDNYETAEFGHYACEPNWIYPTCNHYGMTALKAYDTLTNSGMVKRHLPNWLEKLDTEFTDSSGSIIGLRSQLTGFAVPFPVGEAGYAYFENCFNTARAQKLWAIAREEIQQFIVTDTDGSPRLELQGEGLDAGNYKPGHVGSYAVYLACAREFGDESIATAAFNALERDGMPSREGGVLRYQKGSNMSNATAIMGLVMDIGDFRKSFTESLPDACLNGPMIEALNYPDVLVARAVSSDGNDLEAIFYPGIDSGVKQIEIGQLQPGRDYRLTGAKDDLVTADEGGRASIAVHFDGRTEFRLTPA